MFLDVLLTLKSHLDPTLIFTFFLILQRILPVFFTFLNRQIWFIKESIKVIYYRQRKTISMVVYRKIDGKISANPAVNSADAKYNAKYAIIIPLESILAGYEQNRKQSQELQHKELQLQNSQDLETRYTLANPDVVREGIYHNIQLMKKMDLQVPKGILTEINDALNTYSRFAKSIDKLKKTCNYKLFVEEIDVIGTPHAANANTAHQIYDADISHANNVLLDDLILLKKELNSLGKADYFKKRKDYINKGVRRFSDDFARFIQLTGSKIPIYSAEEQKKMGYSQEHLKKTGKANREKTLSEKIYLSFAHLMREDCGFNKKLISKDLYELARENLSSAELYTLNNQIRSLSISVEEEKFEKNKNKFANSLESLVGFSKDYERVDGRNKEYALRNIALLAYSGVKKELKNYSGLGPDLKKIVGEYSDNLDFRAKFSGAGKNKLSFPQVDTQLDMYKFVHDKRVNENMKYKDIAVAARKEMADYLMRNLEFSKDLSVSEMKTTIERILPSENKFMSQSTIRRMIDAYRKHAGSGKEKMSLEGTSAVAVAQEKSEAAEPIDSPRVSIMADFKSRKEKLMSERAEERKSQETLTEEAVRELKQKFQQKRN